MRACRKPHKSKSLIHGYKLKNYINLAGKAVKVIPYCLCGWEGTAFYDHANARLCYLKKHLGWEIQKAFKDSQQIQYQGCGPLV